MPKYKDIDYDLFNSYFYYDETALSFLRWREDHAVAGGLNGNYWQVELLDMGQFKVHRIIFCIMNGGIDSELMIDHIDRNTRNNNIWNLRAVDSSQNNYNRTLVSMKTVSALMVSLETFTLIKFAPVIVSGVII